MSLWFPGGLFRLRCRERGAARERRLLVLRRCPRERAPRLGRGQARMSWLVFAVLRYFGLPRRKRGTLSPRHERDATIHSSSYRLMEAQCATCHTVNVMPLKLNRGVRWRHARLLGSCQVCGSYMYGEFEFIPNGTKEQD